MSQNWSKFGILKKAYHEGKYYCIENKEGELRKIHKTKFSKSYKIVKNKITGLINKSIEIGTVADNLTGRWSSTLWFSDIRLDKSKNKESSSIFDLTIEQIIERDEGQEIEFKESYSIPPNFHNKEKGQTPKSDSYRSKVISVIAAFLNTNNGILIIGIKDSKNSNSGKPEIVGIEKELVKNDKDLFLRGVMSKANQMLGPVSSKFIEPYIVTHKDKNLCIIKCKRSNEPVFLVDGDKEDFYIKIKSMSTPLKHSETVKWINNNFKKKLTN